MFIASMSDVFEDRADLVEPRARLWEALHGLSGWVVPMLLTKRPAVMAAWAAEHGWPAHAWAGTTVEDQRRADERIPHLLRVPAPVRFLSCEPLLQFVNVNAALFTQPPVGEPDESPEAGGLWTGPRALGADGVQWVIAGGESGHGARPSHPEWFRSLRDQCARASVAFHFKQWGAWAPSPQVLGQTPEIAMMPDGAAWTWGTPRPDGLALVARVGKHAAGRLLDGRTHDATPEVTP